MRCTSKILNVIIANAAQQPSAPHRLHSLGCVAPLAPFRTGLEPRAKESKLGRYVGYPIRHRQPRYIGEVPPVARHQRQAVGEGRAADEQIKLAL